MKDSNRGSDALYAMRRLPPTGLTGLLSGLFGFVAVIYFLGRAAHPAFLAVCASLAGAGWAFWNAALDGQPARPLHGGIFGAAAGAIAAMAHMSITNPDACAIVWNMLVVYIAPVTAAMAAAGAATVVWLAGGGRPQPPRGGDRRLLPVLALSVAVCCAAVGPFAVSAVSYWRILTGASLEMRSRHPLAAGGPWLDLENAMVREALSESQERVYEAYDLNGELLWRARAGIGDSRAGARLHVDAVTALPYLCLVEEAGGTVDERKYRTVIGLLDPGRGELAEVWELAALSGPGLPDPGAVAAGRLFGLGQGRLWAYSLPESAPPAELWDIGCEGASSAVASANTVLTYGGREVACFQAASGTLLWTAAVADLSPPVFDGLNSWWLLSTAEGLAAVHEETGRTAWTSPRPAHSQRCLHVEFGASDRVYSLYSGPPGIRDTYVTLTAADRDSGRVLWRIRVEAGAARISGEADGAVFVLGEQGTLLGFEAETGTRLFRVHAGPVTRVFQRPDGTVTLFDEAGAVHRARIRHR